LTVIAIIFLFGLMGYAYYRVCLQRANEFTRILKK
jgi:hypothetical protein